MSELEIVGVAFQFVEHINRRELAPLAALMTADHRFVDMAGDAEEGREVVRAGWADYFARFPDYMIHLSHFFVREDAAILIGRTTGFHLQLPRHAEFQEPVIWSARVANGLVAEWRLYPDTPEVHRELDISLEEEG